MKSSRFFAYLQLMRPANIVTAMADILAGVPIALFWLTIPFASSEAIEVSKSWDSSFLLSTKQFLLANFYAFLFIIQNAWESISLLLLSTIGLYGGGVVFNDVFDAKLDAIERPERPIPSGRASLLGATILGCVLLLFGVIFAFLNSRFSGIISVLIAFFALFYDKIGKHQSWGPLNMGLCRGLNIFLGATVGLDHAKGGFGVWGISRLSPFWEHLTDYKAYYISLIPILYIAAITSVSRGEVHGGSKKSFYLPFALYGVVVLAILAILLVTNLPGIIFLVLFCYLIFPPLIRAYRDPQPRNIGMAVKAGVIALIAMDAAIAAAFAGILYGLIVLALLPLSRFLAKSFAVT